MKSCSLIRTKNALTVAKSAKENNISEIKHITLEVGEPAKTVVENGLAVPLTYEEACARVDLAAKHGLVGQAANR